MEHNRALAEAAKHMSPEDEQAAFEDYQNFTGV